MHTNYRYQRFLLLQLFNLADKCVVAKVNGDLWDLDRPFEKDSQLQLVKFEDKDGTLLFSM
jgi:threonyl-tRNA synthetase